MMDHVHDQSKERTEDQPAPDEDHTETVDDGSYYYDDSTNYQTYRDDDDDDAPDEDE